MRKISLGTAFMFCMNMPAYALENGSYTVALRAGDGTRFNIAEIEVSGGGYSVEMRDSPFSDHFLSMRPFKCVEGPEKLWCHVPYPYEIARDLGSDHIDLEYDFLFVWKEEGDYGIDLWNGVYYVLRPEGDGLRGEMHEMDMNQLAAPPASGELRPITAKHLEPADPDSHWLPELQIVPRQ